MRYRRVLVVQSLRAEEAWLPVAVERGASLQGASVRLLVQTTLAPRQDGSLALAKHHRAIDPVVAGEAVRGHEQGVRVARVEQGGARTVRTASSLARAVETFGAIDEAAIRPRIFADCGRRGVFELAFASAAVLLDEEERPAAVLWASDFAVRSRAASELHRVVLAASDKRAYGDIAPEFARGHFGYAAEPGAASPEPLDDAERDALTVARYEAWEHLPEPALELERFGGISAELTAHPEARAEVLARHSLDEDRWSLEEMAWLRRFSEAAGRGDGSDIERYGRVVAAAHAREPMRQLSADEAAAIRGALDPARALREAGISVPRYLGAEKLDAASLALRAGARGGGS